MLDDEALKTAKDLLGISFCTLRAVIDVESGGDGFLPDGRPKILFEGHIFWRELTKRGIDPSPLAEKHPTILYPQWVQTAYRGGSGEWARLDEASSIHYEAACASASWGLFQILGTNYAACGFDSVGAFASAMHESEDRQLEAFCRFLRSNRLVHSLKIRDWARFARKYNGPGYAKNRYDEKLAARYAICAGSI
jgi:hypothetical protein